MIERLPDRDAFLVRERDQPIQRGPDRHPKPLVDVEPSLADAALDQDVHPNRRGAKAIEEAHQSV